MKIIRFITSHVTLNFQRLVSYRLISLRKFSGVWEQQHLKRMLHDYGVDCVFDVGANYGQYAQMLRRKANFKGLIISFEPIPDAAAILRKLSANDPLWIIEECALSKSNGTQTFNIMSDSQFSSLSEPNHDEIQSFKDMNKVSESIQVKTETLDSAFGRLQRKFTFECPFLKMDTQGFDVEVVNHGKSVINQFIGLQSELAVNKLYKDSVDFREAITIYEQHGFSLSAFVPNNEGHFPRLVETDCIMLRSDLL
jgi:FkbM family methyltransferase